MAFDKWIALVATEHDIALLSAIAKQDGDAGKSATIRRLIRDEARRRNISVVLSPENESPQELQPA